MFKRLIAIIRYRYLWRARARFRIYRLRAIRRVLWRLHGSNAVYKPYGANKGSGWAGRYLWNGHVVCYVNEFGTKWF